VLLAAVAVCAAGAVALGFLMGNTYGNRADAVEDGGFFDRTGALLTIEREAPGDRVGDDVGEGTVSAMDPAPKAEQVRAAAQIEAATKMATAFLNLDHENVEANIEAVKSLATGAFLRQYSKAAKDLIDLIRLAKATQTGEVEWAGLVAGDDDSADVIVATNGTVANKETEFEPVARTYRLQLHLDLVDDRWLTSDLQYVR
jgi:Mce-associated membrane protein